MQNTCLFDQDNDSLTFLLVIQPIISLNFSPNLTKLRGLLNFLYNSVLTALFRGCPKQNQPRWTWLSSTTSESERYYRHKEVKPPAYTIIFI